MNGQCLICLPNQKRAASRVLLLCKPICAPSHEAGSSCARHLFDSIANKERVVRSDVETLTGKEVDPRIRLGELYIAGKDDDIEERVERRVGPTRDILRKRVRNNSELEVRAPEFLECFEDSRIDVAQDGSLLRYPFTPKLVQHVHACRATER